MEQQIFIRRLAIAAGFVLVLLCIWVFFAKALQAMLLVFGGVLVAVLLATLADWLTGLTRMPRGLSLTLVVVFLFGALTLGGWLLAPAIAQEAGGVAENMQQTFEKFRKYVAGFGWGRQLMEEAQKMDGAVSGAAFHVGSWFTSALGALSGVLIVLFVGLFLAAQPQLYLNGILRMMPISARPRIGELSHELGHVLRWWLLGQVVSMIVLGAQITLGLWLLKVPMALPLGLLSAVLTFVPYVGPILATIPAVLVALTVSSTKAFYVLLLCIAVQNVEGYLLTPAIHQKAVSLPAGLTVAFQVLMALLAGAMGIILATPLLAVIFVLVRRLYVEDVLGDSLDEPATTDGDYHETHQTHQPSGGGKPRKGTE
jgi:predicted PurR-regulated permease PerM